jgi:DNA-binding response OmpR family regulator
LIRLIRGRSPAPIVALNEVSDLQQTLGLYAAGVDDVVRKPVHVREIVARVGAILRRIDVRAASGAPASVGEMRVYFDGRDPEIRGEILALPRRERRILEYMVKNQGRRATKRQIFDFVYGMVNETVEESVIECHVSKLRKKLRDRLGFDPIDSKRYVGYVIEAPMPQRMLAAI